MTSFYVYAILPARTSFPSDLEGIHGESLRLIPSRELAALVGESPESDVIATPELASAHHSIITRLREFVPALPVRFGTVIDGEDRVIESLERHYEQLNSDIQRLDGKVEFGITVLWGDRVAQSDPPAAPETEQFDSGQQYMRRRLAQYQYENELKRLAEALSADIEAGLAEAVCDRVTSVLPTPTIPFRGSFLVDEGASENLVRAFESIRSRNGDLRFLLVGPWPPYSFVSVTDEIDAGMFGANTI